MSTYAEAMRMPTKTQQAEAPYRAAEAATVEAWKIDSPQAWREAQQAWVAAAILMPTIRDYARDLARVCAVESREARSR